MSLGIIEGVAEAANSVLKITAGHFADRTGRQSGSCSRATGFSARSAAGSGRGSWTHVLALRFVDRLGKGIRGAPRDAMLGHLRRRTCAAASTVSTARWITPAPSWAL